MGLFLIPRVAEWKGGIARNGNRISMANCISCEHPGDGISMELPDWANKAIEELRAATRWSKDWKPEKWDRKIVVGEATFKGDAVEGALAGCISVGAAQYMVMIIRDHIGNRQRVAAV